MARIEVRIEITGNVWKVLARPGERVSEDDALLILESMKMEIPVLAPEDGVVKEILVSEGELITEGSLAVVLES
jgi:acetyl-CoA carboxylase biotin carboxyl carrier protein